MAQFRSRTSVLRLTTAAALLTGVVFTAATSDTSAGSNGAVGITMRDECDPASFNAAIGPGTCVGDGDVSFGEFLSQLNPVDGGHEEWEFKPAMKEVDKGATLSIRNRGGETHSFTQVDSFGATPIPEAAILNAALPPGTPFAVPTAGKDPMFIPSGGTGLITGLTPGTYRFECLIHPWMRSTIVVKSR